MAFDLKHHRLCGELIDLEPLCQKHRDEMAVALNSDADGWAQMTAPGFGAHFNSWWDQAFKEIAEAGRLAYTIRLHQTSKVVGTTSFMNFRPKYRGVLIGSTFITPSERGGLINAEAKRLMLEQAFDTGALRVEWWIAGTNVRSQAALARFGAVREGVLRRHWIGWRGEIHDTVVYAVTDLDWPRVRAQLVSFSATA